MRNTLKTFAVCLAAALSFSCGKDNPAPRIEVLTSGGLSLTSTLSIPVEGGNFDLTVKAQSDLDIFYEQAQETEEGWFTMQEVSKIAKGEYLVRCMAKPLVGNLNLRRGTLSFSAPEEYIGKFLDVRQGYEMVVQEAFSSLTGKQLTLAPGDSWESGLLTGISSIKDAWLTFDARAEGGADYIPLYVELIGGATFPEIARKVCATDIAPSAEFVPENLYKLHIYNSGVVFSSETRIRLTLPSDAGAPIYLDNLTIYNIPVAKDGIIGEEENEEGIEE